LGEIEQLIFEFPSIKACVCVVHALQICAYIVLNEDSADDCLSCLYKYLSSRLPSYMVPRHIVSIDSIPLTSVGKLDRRRLPDPDVGESGIVVAVTPPASELQQVVQAAFASVLSVDANTICCLNSAFFSIGGHSLAALRLLFSLKKSLNVDIALSALFQNPTVSGLASHISNILSDFQSPSSALSMHLVEMRACYEPQSILIFVHPAGASYLCYLPLLKYISSNVSIMALDDSFFDGSSTNSFESISQVASLCLPAVQSCMSKSVPVHLAGWSYGGVVAFEIAQELLKSGLSPASLMFVAVGTHLIFSSFSRHHRMFDAPLGQHHRASTSPVEHRLRDMHLVSQSSTFHHITVFSLYTGNPRARRKFFFAQARRAALQKLQSHIGHVSYSCSDFHLFFFMTIFPPSSIFNSCEQACAV
jgi:hypothetical protein